MHSVESPLSHSIFLHCAGFIALISLKHLITAVGIFDSFRIGIEYVVVKCQDSAS